MDFFRRSQGRPARLGIFPGTFNPLTVAHMALAQASLQFVDEVVFVLPRVFPHKHYSGATFGQRVDMLTAAAECDVRFSIAATEQGLFIDIARECRAVYGPVQLSFLCGRDAAERIAGWDYGRAGAWEEMLREFDLMVAARGGEYQPGPSSPFRPIVLDPGCDAVSATEVRRRIAAGEPWEGLVPEIIHAQVSEIYAVRRFGSGQE